MRTKLGLVILFLSFSVSCATSSLETNLAPEDKQFLSAVRYLITKEERKLFLRLMPSERQAFIDEFWRKRDPDPETEKNEFKEEYFKRIQEANNLFSHGGKTGWLQDRGRIYILIGPPEQREVYPSGYTFYDPPMEIWHYGFYLLVFVDSDWDGNFELQPQSARLIAEIISARMQLKPKIQPESDLTQVFFDFKLSFLRTEDQKPVIRLEVPYKKIWFSAEGDMLRTTLELTLEIFDRSEKKVWEDSRTYPLSLSQADLKEEMAKDYVIDIPLFLDPGDYTLTATLKNSMDKSQVSKKIKFEIEEG